MEVPLPLANLPAMHPCLLWGDILLATVAVFEDLGQERPFRFCLALEEMPGYGTDQVDCLIDPGGVRADQVSRVRRTYEPFRRVELAAIALAGLGLAHAGGHEIKDVAIRGSAADYLVDEAHHLLEIAGRSRRRDLALAWEQRWERLKTRLGGGFYVCVVELETPAG